MLKCAVLALSSSLKTKFQKLGRLGCWDVGMLLLDPGWLRASHSTYWANLKTAHGRNKHLLPALEAAAAKLHEGKTVLVHCKQGRHRTGAFLGVLKARVT